MKAGIKPAPPLPKSALAGKSLKDLPGVKKLPGASQVKAVLKPDSPPQLKPPLAPKGLVSKPGVTELKPLVSKKPAVSVGPDAVKKVGIDSPKMSPPAKDDLLAKKVSPEIGMVKKLDPPKSVSVLEKANVPKATDLASLPLKSDVKPVPAAKFQTTASDLPPSSGIQSEQKSESQCKVVPSMTKSSESKAKLVPSKEGSHDSDQALGKSQVPGLTKSQVQATQESSDYSNGSVASANKGLGSGQSNSHSGMLPQIGGGGMSGVPNIFDKSGSLNFQGLDPALWQMVTTIAAICSTACQNGGRSRSRHCCRKHHSRRRKKEMELKDADSNCSNKNSSDHNETLEEQTQNESGNGKAKKTGERRSNQNDNTVSGTKWHGIEKKIATIRGLRDLEDSDSDVDDDELAASDALVHGIGRPRYSDAVEFPSEISAINNGSKARRYLAKQGVCTGPKFSKSPFVGGLSAARRRPYSSLTEMAAYFSNIEPQDQNDVIVMLLACRKLEKQIEEQQVVMQLLEHDLKEAQSLLRFPPEWRSLSSNEVLGHSPLPAGQIPSTNDPPYVSNHPNVEPPWVNKRPKDGLPSRAPTKL